MTFSVINTNRDLSDKFQDTVFENNKAFKVSNFYGKGCATQYQRKEKKQIVLKKCLILKKGAF